MEEVNLTKDTPGRNGSINWMKYLSQVLNLSIPYNSLLNRLLVAITSSEIPARRIQLRHVVCALRREVSSGGRVVRPMITDPVPVDLRPGDGLPALIRRGPRGRDESHAIEVFVASDLRLADSGFGVV